MIRLFHYVFGCSMIITISSCGLSEEEINMKAEEVFKNRIEKIKKEKMAECRSEAARIAEEIVDSLIYAQQLNPLQENQYNPTIPKRPVFVPVDSAVFNSKESVKPIVQ